MTRHIGLAAIATAMVVASAVVQATDAQRQAQVARLGAGVMPFSLAATTHVFTKTANGGVQRVVAKSPRDAAQVRHVREHLRGMQNQFLTGDFSAPSRVHGNEMPGLSNLMAAGPGEVTIDYKDVDAGAELTYRTADAKLVGALHRWFDAQLSDHGADAIAIRHHQHRDMGRKLRRSSVRAAAGRSSSEVRATGAEPDPPRSFLVAGSHECSLHVGVHPVDRHR